MRGSAARRQLRLAALGVAAIFLVGTLGPVASATPSAPTRTTAQSPASADPDGLQGLVQRIVDAGAPGATLLVRDGVSTRTYTSGVADESSGRVLQPADDFRVGSITKSFVATLTLQLVDRGAIVLDAPIATYLPHLLPDGAHITVRQLLQHTSGLFDYTGDPEFTKGLLARRSWHPRELVALSAKHDVLFPPGTQWSYSNTNYIVLGILVRTVGDAGMKQQLEDRIIGPLDLDSTRFYVHARHIVEPHSHGYAIRRSGDLWDVTSRFEPSWAWTAGALVSNDMDLATFYRALLSGQVLPKALLAEMKDTVPAGAGVGYGLGLLSENLACGTAWGHDGLYVGYYVLALTSEDGNHQAVLAMNLDPANGYPPPGLIDAFAAAVSGGYCGTDGEAPPPSTPGPDAPTAVLPDGS